MGFVLFLGFGGSDKVAESQAGETGQAANRLRIRTAIAVCLDVRRLFRSGRPTVDATLPQPQRRRFEDNRHSAVGTS